VAVEDGAEHFQGIRIAILVDIAQDRRLVAHDQYGQFGRRLDGDAARAVLGGFDLLPADRQGAPFELAVMFFGQREDGLVIDIAADHDVSVVRHVPGVVPGLGVGGGHRLQVVHPADDGAAVGVGLEGDRVHLLEELGLRTVVGAHAALLHDDLDLLREFLGVDVQVAHAVGFELHHLVQLFLRHLLEIGGVVAAGEGIVAAAGGRDAFVEFAGADTGRALEHHVLEDVGDAGGAIHLVHAADAVPDHLDRRRGAMVFLDDDAQAVLQRGFVGVGVGRGKQPGGQQKGD